MTCACHGQTFCPDLEFSHYDDDQPVFKKRVTPPAVVGPTGYDENVGMTIGLDRAEGALRYVELALAELDRQGVGVLARQYLINARFLLMGKK